MELVPGSTKGTITPVFSVRQGVVVPNAICGAMTSELFAAYADATLGPYLHPGGTTVVDRFNGHTTTGTVSANCGAQFRRLLPHSSNLFLIENAGSKFEIALRNANARTW